MTKIVIEPASNGYIITTHHKDSELWNYSDTVVVEDHGTKHHIVQMLYSLLESLGELGSKHDSERVRVIVVDKDGKEVFGD